MEQAVSGFMIHQLHVTRDKGAIMEEKEKGGKTSCWLISNGSIPLWGYYGKKHGKGKTEQIQR